MVQGKIKRRMNAAMSSTALSRPVVHDLSEYIARVLNVQEATTEDANAAMLFLILSRLAENAGVDLKAPTVEEERRIVAGYTAVNRLLREIAWML